LLLNVLRKAFSFPVMLASIVTAFVLLGAGASISDPDLWWHLRNAEYLVAHHTTPAADLFSYTTQNHPWMNHEWLSEVPYYLAWTAGGVLGVYALFVGLLCVIMLGIFYWAYRQSGNLKAAFIIACFSVFLARVNFGPRTILFGYVFLLIQLLVLARFREKGEAPLWVLPPLFCIWINTHGSWLLGMIVFVIYLVAGWVEGRWGRVEAVRWPPAQRQRLLLALGASVAALLVNPFTYRLVAYPFDLAFKQKHNIRFIEEWASVDFNDARGVVVLILLAAIFLGGVLRSSLWRLEEVLLAGFALYAGLKHVRFLFLAAILLAPLLAKTLDMIPPYRPEIDKWMLNAAVIVFALAFVIPRLPSRQVLDADVARKFPVSAVRFLNAHPSSGNLFNRYEWGGYLIYFSRDRKVFVDGRTDIFDYTGVLKQYVDTAAIKSPMEVLDAYRVATVLVSPGSPLAYLLRRSGGWKVTYQDNVATVLERDSSASPASDPAGEGRRE
jgi:hypothetical protein